MSHYDSQRQTEEEKIAALAKSRRAAIRDKILPVLGELEHLLIQARYSVSHDEHQHLTQKLNEIKGLVNLYT